MENNYNPLLIEEEAQRFWEEQQPFTVTEDLNREKYYCLSMLPYPSGELHVGHVRNYTIGDVIARYQHMNGKNVLQPMGWDAFGLPAENAAIQHQLTPTDWTKKNINKMRKQLKRLGFAFDWKREIATCDPSYYRWEQWLFVRLFKKGLIYKKSAMVNWDPVDKTVLANEQVIDGCGWRSGAPVERKEIPQWFFKITDYAEELLDGLDELTQWPPQVVTMQRNWIGRSEGANVKFKIIKPTKEYIDIYTTRPDTIMGATFLAVAAQHPLAITAATESNQIRKFIKQCNTSSVAEADLSTQEKQGIFSGLYAKHPITKEKLPIWITNFVLMDYGSGAIMGVPAHDSRDFEFATEFDIPIHQVIASPDHDNNAVLTEAYTEKGTLINSGEFDGLSSEKASKYIINQLEAEQLGEHAIQYRLRDWGISRQRYWGTPIPMISCKHCGDVAVPEEDLPVELPLNIIPSSEGSPLKHNAEYYNVKCPQCGRSAMRDTDTMDTFVESSWYYLRYCSFDQDLAMLDNRAKYWTPVDTYIGGIEHAILHLLYARFMHKLLRDEGLVNSNEPFTQLITQGMVLKDGSKMSKSKGNTVSPQALIKQYGADTLRLFQMFAAPPEQSLEWSDSGVEGAYRFLKKLWNYCHTIKPIIESLQPNIDTNSSTNELHSDPNYQQLHTLLQQATFDMERQQFNTVVSAAMKILNLLTQLDIKSPLEERVAYHGTSILLRILAPITPHITHHLWQDLALGVSIFDANWPQVDNAALQEQQHTIIIQVNGKLRAKMNIAAGATEEEITLAAKNNEQVEKYLTNKIINKTIIVPKKLINMVVTDA